MPAVAKSAGWALRTKLPWASEISVTRASKPWPSGWSVTCEGRGAGATVASKYRPSFAKATAGAEGGEALALVDVDVAVAQDAKEDGSELRGIIGGAQLGGEVGDRAVEFGLIAEKEERHLRHEVEAEVGALLGHLECGADGDDAGVTARLLGGALSDEGDDEPAHRFAFEQNAVGRAEFFLDVVAKGVEIGDGVGNDGAVAAVAGFRDDPAFVEEGLVGEVGGGEIGDERPAGFAEAMGKEQEAGVPVRGAGEGEFCPRDFAGLEGDGGGRGTERAGANEQAREQRQTHAARYSMERWHGEEMKGFGIPVDSRLVADG